MSDNVINVGYGVTTDTPKESTGSIPPGINEGVTFVNCGFERLTDDETKDPVLCFNYELDGALLRDVMFPIDPEQIGERFEQKPPGPSKISIEQIGLKKGDVPTLQQVVAQRFLNFNKKIKQILDAFIKDENAALTGNLDSYQKYGEAVIEKLQGFFGKKVRLKVLLDDKNFSTIPYYGKFIEYEVEESKSKLQIGAKDKVQISGPAAGGAPPQMAGAAPPPMSTASTAAPTAPPPSAPPPPPAPTPTAPAGDAKAAG